MGCVLCLLTLQHPVVLMVDFMKIIIIFRLKRRKLLYGLSCAIELVVLKKEIRRAKDCCISKTRELANPSVYLCMYCQKLLLKKKRLDEELAEIRTTIDSKLRLITEIVPKRTVRINARSVASRIQ